MSEQRLIDANELITFKTLVMSCDEEWFVKMSDIENAPTVDPVKHEKWVYDGGNAYRRYYRCSGCKALWEGKSKYCAECGAKMDKEE